MRLKIKNNQKGFTIIETMIVLAIVAAITAGIFIMASTLRRNSRDNARLSDIGVVATGIVDYVAGSGAVPTGVTGTSGTDATKVRIENLTRYEVANINKTGTGNLLPTSAGTGGTTTVDDGDITVLVYATDATNGNAINRSLATGTGCKNGADTAKDCAMTVKAKKATGATGTSVLGLPSDDDLLIISNAECKGDNKEQVVSDTAASTSVAILYKLEKHNAPQCWQAVV